MVEISGLYERHSSPEIYTHPYRSQLMLHLYYYELSHASTQSKGKKSEPTESYLSTQPLSHLFVCYMVKLVS